MAREIQESVKVKGPKGQPGKCVLYTDGTIRIDWARFSYPHLAKAFKKEGDQGEAKYGILGLLGKKSHKEAIRLINDRIDALLKENKVKKLSADKKFMRDGDESDREEHEGFMTVSARESRRPPLRDRRNEVVEPEDAAEVFQPGYWGTILIRPWYQDNKFGKRVNAGLSSVQMVMKDEVFGEGRLSEEDLDDTFDSYDDDDDDDDDRGSKSKKRSRDYDDDDDDEDDRRRSKAKSKKRRSRDDDDDDDDDDI